MFILGVIDGIVMGPAGLAAREEFMQAEGLSPHGRHHEIYLSDPRRVPPEKLKTILRPRVSTKG